MRPLTKNGDNEQYFKYSPSSPFLPSVALGTLLTTNWVMVLIIGGRGKWVTLRLMGVMGALRLMGRMGNAYA